MKHLKMLGLSMLAGSALMAFGGGSASATTLTCTEPAGTKTTCKVGTKMSASVQSESSLLLRAGFAEITCSGGTTEDEISSAGGAEKPVTGKIVQLSYTGCGSATVDVLSKGSGEIEVGATGNAGSLRAFGSEITFGVLGTSCVYGGGSGTKIGTVTGGSPAKITISAKVPKISGGFLCANPAEWTGSYTVTSPTWLGID
jgi:hypothetical protein